MCGGTVHMFGDPVHLCCARQTCGFYRRTCVAGDKGIDATHFTCAEGHQDIDVSGITCAAGHNGMVVQVKGIDVSQNTDVAGGNTCAEVHQGIDAPHFTCAAGRNIYANRWSASKRQRLAGAARGCEPESRPPHAVQPGRPPRPGAVTLELGQAWCTMTEANSPLAMPAQLN